MEQEQKNITTIISIENPYSQYDFSILDSTFQGVDFSQEIDNIPKESKGKKSKKRKVK